MKWIGVFTAFASILMTSCSFADSLSNFDCSTENEVYKLLLHNYDLWFDELYAMGEDSLGGRTKFLLEGLGRVYASQPDGWPLEYRDWDIEGRLLVVTTAKDIYVDASNDYGIFGSFGYIYAEQTDLSTTFTEYKFEMLSDNIYCFSIDR